MIIDTMVFAYALLKVEGKFQESTLILERVDCIVVPDSFRAELANVTWQWVSHRGVSATMANEVLQDADALIDQVVSSERIWVQALRLSIQKNHPVYDTLFIAAAEVLDDQVVTYDGAMQAKFPRQVLSPQQFLDLES